MYVQVVGDQTLFGQLALEVQEESRQTPLQVKLAKLAKQISQFGYVGACGIMIAIILQNVLTGHMPENWPRMDVLNCRSRFHFRDHHCMRGTGRLTVINIHPVFLPEHPDDQR